MTTTGHILLPWIAPYYLYAGYGINGSAWLGHLPSTSSSSSYILTLLTVLLTLPAVSVAHIA